MKKLVLSFMLMANCLPSPALAECRQKNGSYWVQILEDTISVDIKNEDRKFCYKEIYKVLVEYDDSPLYLKESMPCANVYITPEPDKFENGWIRVAHVFHFVGSSIFDGDVKIDFKYKKHLCKVSFKARYTYRIPI